MGKWYQHILISGILLGVLSLAPGVANGEGGNGGAQADQQRRLTELFQRAELLDRSSDTVQAYLALREAVRLEQLWTNNAVGTDGVAMRELSHFTKLLIKRDDAGLMRVLHSRKVPRGDKLGIVRQLEEDIIVNHPGAMADGLLQGYEE